MKNPESITAIVFFLALIGCGEPTKQTGPSGSDSDQVTMAVIALGNAMINKDSTALHHLTLDGLTYGHSSGRIEDKTQFIDGIVNGSFVFNTIERTDQSISVHGDTAIARHILNAEATSDGVPVDLRIGIIMTFQKNGSWKLLARQAYKL